SFTRLCVAKSGPKRSRIRWMVERTFAWLGRCRRLTKDREKRVVSSEAWVKLAMIQLMLRRLKPQGLEAEFQYHTAA
ncbi:MAG: transposase, partial [Bacteroidales bacterium]|nr:transposase [Bacteroidales bacterium]